MHIAGGFVIENRSHIYHVNDDTILPVRRIWTMNALGDEYALYIDDAIGVCISLRDYIWWQGNKTFCSSAGWSATGYADGKVFKQVQRWGFPHSPYSEKLHKVV